MGLEAEEVEEAFAHFDDLLAFEAADELLGFVDDAEALSEGEELEDEFVGLVEGELDLV